MVLRAHWSGRWEAGCKAIRAIVAEDSGLGHCIAKLERVEVDSGDSGSGHYTAKLERVEVDCYSDRFQEWEQ